VKAKLLQHWYYHYTYLSSLTPKTKKTSPLPKRSVKKSLQLHPHTAENHFLDNRDSSMLSIWYALLDRYTKTTSSHRKLHWGSGHYST
jgi:hypothetical protein